MATDRPASPSRRFREGNHVTPLLLRREVAAETLGMSLDHFERYVQPHLAIVRVGRLRLVPIAELDRWVEVSAERV